MIAAQYEKIAAQGEQVSSLVEKNKTQVKKFSELEAYCEALDENIST